MSGADTEVMHMEEMLELSEPASEHGVILEHAEDGRLMLTVAGVPIAVRVRECFPWSEPGRHIALRGEDEEELGLIDDPATLNLESRAARELARGARGR